MLVVVRHLCCTRLSVELFKVFSRSGIGTLARYIVDNETRERVGCYNPGPSIGRFNVDSKTIVLQPALPK